MEGALHEVYDGFTLKKVMAPLEGGPEFAPAQRGAPPPKKVERVISEYVDRKKGTIFFKLTTCLLLNSLDHHHTLQML